MNRIIDPSRAKPITQSMGPGHHRAKQQAGETVALEHTIGDDDKRSRGAADLDARTAEGRNDTPADDRGEQPLLRLHSRRDGKGHRQWESQGHDVQPGHAVAPELGGRIIAQGVAQFRPEWNRNRHVGLIRAHGALCYRRKEPDATTAAVESPVWPAKAGADSAGFAIWNDFVFISGAALLVRASVGREMMRKEQIVVHQPPTPG